MVTHVEIVLEELIIPANPTPQSLKYHEFSLPDQLMLTCYVPLIFFCQNHSSSNTDRAQRSQQLKQSLSNVLTKFYPLAGRINGNSSIDCNDSGALYVEAQVHGDLSQAIQNVAFEDFNQYLPLQPHPSRENENDSKRDIPVLAVKISFFDCGGTAIGVCISHKIADILSLVTFLKAWSATCRGETDIMQPNFELGYHLFPPMENIPATTMTPQEKMVMKRFVFEKEKLAAIREQASLASEVQNPTRVEAVSAYIWKHFMNVTQAKFDAKKRFAAIHAVNLRRRMSEPVPDFAMGNFLTTAIAIAEDKNYHDLVGQLRAAIGKIDKEFVKEIQNGMLYLNYLSEEKQLFSSPEMVPYIFTSWCRLPFYEMDYGWGKPLSVCVPPMAMKNTVMLMDTKSGDGVEAWISLEEDDMAMLPSEFLLLENNDFSK